MATMSAAQVSHANWDELLKKRVTENGKVKYAEFNIAEKEKLSEYLGMLAKNLPDDSWSVQEEMAYWINMYNAVTVRLILDHYPIKSIDELQPLFRIPGFYSIWHITYLDQEQEKWSLDEIEHDILRKKFNDPRIHFAINCASKSCPKLLNEAYVSDRLEQQLEAQATYFVNHPFYNEIAPNKLVLSKIFSWFESDFTKDGSLISFLNQYAEINIEKEAELDFKRYNWELNE